MKKTLQLRPADFITSKLSKFSWYHQMPFIIQYQVSKDNGKQEKDIYTDCLGPVYTKISYKRNDYKFQEKIKNYILPEKVNKMIKV